MARPHPPGATCILRRAASPLSLSLLSSSLFSSVQGPRGPGGFVCAQDRPCHHRSVARARPRTPGSSVGEGGSPQRLEALLADPALPG